MTTHTQARDALVEYLHTNWPTAYPTLPVFYENQDTVDLDTVGDAFLKAEVAFVKSEQASIELNPMTRTDGHFIISIYARQGTGTRTGMTYFDYLFGLFKHQNLSGVQVGTPTPGHRESHDGWHLQEISIPFWFYGMP